VTRILVLLILWFSPPAQAEWNSSDFSISALPFVGYHAGLSDFDSTAVSPAGGLGLSHGPKVGTRAKAALDRFFVAPDLSFGPMLGVVGTPMLWSIGLIAGTRLGYSGFDVYAGLSHQDFFSYDGSGGSFFRAGAAFDLAGKSSQFFVEAFYGSLTRYAETYQAKCTYYGLEAGIQFPIDFGKHSTRGI
jgi:hypothetical protein